MQSHVLGPSGEGLTIPPPPGHILRRTAVSGGEYAAPCVHAGAVEVESGAAPPSAGCVGASILYILEQRQLRKHL